MSNAETNAHLERIAKALEKLAGIDRDADFTGEPRRLTGYQEPTDVPQEVWDGEKMLRRVSEDLPHENGDYLLHDDGKEGEEV